MFTGLIETLGTITKLTQSGQNIIISIKPDKYPFRALIGDSVAVNGVCLTVEKFVGKELSFTVVCESLKRSSILSAKIGEKVNLERAMLATSRFDGHIVQGHVDDTCKIINDRDAGGSVYRKIMLTEKIVPLIACKGSVAVDGISLTVAELFENSFSVALIPHTQEKTNMYLKKSGDVVNIECDLFARYIQRQLNILGKENSVKKDRKNNILNVLEKSGF